MKPVFFVVILTLSLTAFGVRDGLATADGPDYFAVTGIAADDVLNIRAEPSARSSKIGEIPHDGHGVQNLGCQGGPTFAEWQQMTPAEREQAGRTRWCRIRYGGVEGWVASRFLTEGRAPAAEPAASASNDIRTTRVQFQRGASSAVVEDSITGYESVDYLLGARAGQSMTVSMATNNRFNYFNILPPGETQVSVFTGSTSGNQFEGVLEQSGDYKVRVYLMRNAARRNETANYRLEMMISGGADRSETASPTRTAAASVPAAPEEGGPRLWEVAGVSSALNLRESPSDTAQTVARYAPETVLTNLGCRRAEGRVWCDVQEAGGGPRGYVAAEFLKPAVSPDGAVAMGPDDSALRAGQGDFDATGKIPCAQVRGQPMGPCDFGVARAGGGFATVVVTKPDGVKRGLYFANGKFLGADTSEADGYPKTSGRKEADLHFIRVGDERYEVPDAVILGG